MKQDLFSIRLLVLPVVLIGCHLFLKPVRSQFNHDIEWNAKMWEDRPLPLGYRPQEKPPVVRDMCKPPADFEMDNLKEEVARCKRVQAKMHQIRNIGAPFWRGRYNFLCANLYRTTKWNWSTHEEKLVERWWPPVLIFTGEFIMGTDYRELPRPPGLRTTKRPSVAPRRQTRKPIPKTNPRLKGNSTLH